MKWDFLKVFKQNFFFEGLRIDEITEKKASNYMPSNTRQCKGFTYAECL